MYSEIWINLEIAAYQQKPFTGLSSEVLTTIRDETKLPISHFTYHLFIKAGIFCSGKSVWWNIIKTSRNHLTFKSKWNIFLSLLNMRVSDSAV